MNTITIGLVEDQHLFREGMKSILATQPDFDVTFTAENGWSVIDRLKTKLDHPSVLLVDLSLPPHEHREYSGLELTRDLKREFPEIHILILSVNDDPYVISSAIEAGANGYLVKDCDPQEVIEAVRTVAKSGSYVNAKTLQAMQHRLSGKAKPTKQFDRLSEREQEVLRLICQQMTAEEIGNKLFISPKTVNGHRNNLLQKTGSRNITGLVMYAIKHKIVELL